MCCIGVHVGCRKLMYRFTIRRPNTCPLKVRYLYWCERFHHDSAPWSPCSMDIWYIVFSASLMHRVKPIRTLKSVDGVEGPNSSEKKVEHIDLSSDDRSRERKKHCKVFRTLWDTNLIDFWHNMYIWRFPGPSPRFRTSIYHELPLDLHELRRKICQKSNRTKTCKEHLVCHILSISIKSLISSGVDLNVEF